MHRPKILYKRVHKKLNNTVHNIQFKVNNTDSVTNQNLFTIGIFFMGGWGWEFSGNSDSDCEIFIVRCRKQTVYA